MAIQKHSIDFPKRLIHYRGGSYPFRRVSGHWKEEPDRKINSLVSSDTLNKIINLDGGSGIDELVKSSVALDGKVAFFVPDVLFLSSGVVIKDALMRQVEGFEFTHVGD